MSKKARSTNFGIVVFALSLAQFIMTVDTTIMNIAIPSIVDDLGTTVGAVQTAITMYALTMAAFMLIGAKLGEIYGRKRIFKIGLIIYAVGSAITALAPSIGVLIIGWSLFEGIGASLMMPAMLALITNNFSGKQRISALGIVAGVAGAAAASGPLIGGALSTYSTWRWAFVAEVFIALITFILSKYIIDTAKTSSEKIDKKGALLAAGGLGLFVFGVLQASEYGWVRAIKPFELGDLRFDLFDISIVVYLCALGSFFVYRFFRHELLREKQNLPVLLRVSLLKNMLLRSGLNIVLITQLVLGGFMFVIPLFLQIVLGYSALQSGLALLPLSLSLIFTSIISGKIANKYGVIGPIRFSQLLILSGLLMMILIIDNTTAAIDLLPTMLLIGSGIGIIFPLNQSVVLGSAGVNDSSQVSGLNFTYQQLGMSLGTAVIGSVLLFSLGNGIVSGLTSSSFVEREITQEQSVTVSSNVEFISNDQLEDALTQTRLSPDEIDEFIAINSAARIQALKVSVAAAALFMVLSLVFSGYLKNAYEVSPSAT